MRKDELEDFVEMNRDDFDSVETFQSELFWDEIEKKNSSRRYVLKIVLWSTVIALGLVASVYLNSIFSQNQSFESIAGLTKSQELQRDEMIKYVSMKEQKLKEKNVDLSQLRDFTDELKGLDEIELLIMDDFPESINKEKLVKSMLQYYESKARVLELILLEIDKKEKNEIFEKEIY